ncbi:hypothetical protein PR003_g15701 [Phytophthora rubi]|uniref:Uncharacterized protein n=1 Tax=Phytophthora rubi TaxID=129364 RepID=A0A6A4F6E6_9STRA|nr:hypothetical protein PR003_g15701 [Phytophthora rubi]
MALVLQSAPCSALLSHIPELVTASEEPLQPGVRLNELLAVKPASLSVALMTSAPTPPSTLATLDLPSSSPTRKDAQVSNSTTPTKTRETTRGEDGVQAYVSRLLKRVAEPAGAITDLTSHSFRRGGDQHANGNDRLAAQWIFDRGAWDMSKINTGFAYVYKT